MKSDATYVSALAIILILCGCSGDGRSPVPVLPDENRHLINQNPADNSADKRDTGNHYLWGYWLVIVDEKTLEFEIVPMREVLGHLNVISYLEQSPCTNCFKLAGITPGPGGTLNVDVSIKHPFSSSLLNLTGFDVRGIAMFNGSRMFPASGLNMSDRDLGDGELVNADGYTALYNPTTAGNGMAGYIKGKLATAAAPNAKLNGYKRHITNKPGNTRNAFWAGDTVVITYQVKMPSPFIFGYAIDASWAKPVTKPVQDPITDFGLNANCPEAWKIEVNINPVGEGLTDCGGSTKLTIDVYDWQGKDNVNLPRVECPELFDGFVTASWKLDSINYTRYEATIENIKLAESGTYKCLIIKQAQETHPVMDLSAYQVINLTVKKHKDLIPTAAAKSDKKEALVNEAIQFDGLDSYDNDCNGQSIVKYEWDWDNNGTWDETGSTLSHAWTSIGTYKVQLRVTDDEGSTDILDQPLEIMISQKLPPVAQADADPVPQEPDVPVYFFDNGSFDPDGGSITKYEWDWNNDGTFDEQGKNATHIWSAPGTYFVQFRVTDDEGVTTALDKPLKIKIEQMNPENPIDVTPGHLNISPLATYVDGKYLYVAGGCNGLNIYDISQPSNPVWVNRVANSDWANDVVVSGNYAYVADGDSGLLIIDVDPPNSANLIKVVDTPGKALGVAVQGEYAYVADFDGGFHVIDIEPPESAYIVKTVDVMIDNALDVAVSGNYAYTAGDMGLSVIKIENPAAAVFIMVIFTPGDAEGVDILDGYAYVADGISGLQIIDVDPISSPVIVKGVDTPGEALNVVVSGGYAYVSDDKAGLQIIDVKVPNSAYIVKTVDTPGFAKCAALAGGYACVADYSGGIQIINVNPPELAKIENAIDTLVMAMNVEVIDEYAYVADLIDGVVVIDIVPLDSAYIVKEISTPGSAFDVAIEDGYAYVADGASGLVILDIDPLDLAHIAHTVDTPGNAEAVAIGDDYAYVADNTGGFHIISIEFPESAYIVNSVSMASYALDVAVSGGYAFVSDYVNLTVIDIDPPELASIVNEVYTPGGGIGVAVSGAYVYVADWHSGLQIININPPESAYIVKEVDTPGEAYDAAILGGWAYVADKYHGLQIIDVYPPDSAGIVKFIDTPNWANGVTAHDNYAYVADREGGLRIIELW